MSQDDLLRNLLMKFTRDMNDIKAQIRPMIQEQLRILSQDLCSLNRPSYEELANSAHRIETVILNFEEKLVDMLITRTVNHLRLTVQPIVEGLKEPQRELINAHIARVEVSEIDTLKRHLQTLTGKIVDQRKYIHELLVNKYPEFKVLDALAGQEPVTAALLVKQTQLSPRRINTVLSLLEKDGYIRSEKNGRRKLFRFLNAPWTDLED